MTTQQISDYTVIPTPPPTVFSFTNTIFQRGISLVSNTQLTVTETGVYEAYYSIQLHRISGGFGAYAYIWIRVNNINVPDTNGRVATNSNNADTLPTVSYYIQLNAGDYLEFIAQADADTIEALALTPAIGPGIPSIIVGLKRIG